MKHAPKHPKFTYPTHCPWCRTDLGVTVKLVDNADRVHECTKCSNQFTAPAWSGSCPVCKAPAAQIRPIRTLTAGESLPGETLCPKCDQRKMALDTAIAEGGVGFNCDGCGTFGVFAKSTTFAQETRTKAGKEAPEHMSVTLERCPQCPTLPTDGISPQTSP